MTTNGTSLNHSASEAVEDTASRVQGRLQSLRRAFRSGNTRPLSWRREQLRALKRLVEEKEDVFVEALAQDMGKPAFEAWIGELALLSGEVDHALKRLSSWTKGKKIRPGLVHQPARAYIRPEPLGTILIIGPWNYPVQLIFAPMIGAIAAGNTIAVKPSELAPHTSAALAEWIPRYLDPECITVFEGGIETSQALLAERFDHIFYTGGGNVGRIVMEAAAKHLTPVTLELGGKSPCIVDAQVDLEVAARRITWGKYFNAGQTCVAPDHVLVHQSIASAFTEAVKKNIRRSFGEAPEESPDYTRMINDRHFERVSGLMKDGVSILHGGDTNPDTRYIGPTVLGDVQPDAPVMQDEIFGPLMPIIPVQDIDEALDQINARPKPLALYVFSKRKRIRQHVIDNTSSGGVCLNDCLAHLSVPELPFGGVGPSGMGAYHGKASFETFSHMKSILDKGTFPDPALRYPPYTESNKKWARRLL